MHTPELPPHDPARPVRALVQRVHGPEFPLHTPAQPVRGPEFLPHALVQRVRAPEILLHAAERERLEGQLELVPGYIAPKRRTSQH